MAQKKKGSALFFSMEEKKKKKKKKKRQKKKLTTCAISTRNLLRAPSLSFYFLAKVMAITIQGFYRCCMGGKRTSRQVLCIVQRFRAQLHQDFLFYFILTTTGVCIVQQKILKVTSANFAVVNMRRKESEREKCIFFFKFFFFMNQMGRFLFFLIK